MNRKAVIFGIKGYYLNRKEKKFLKENKPWGIILFTRNIKNLGQLKILVKDIKNIFNDENYPILIDQEGGKVSRLNEIINLSYFSQDFFGKLYKKDRKLFYKVYKIYVDKVCEILNKVGVNINTVPVLDVRRNFTHNFIFDRTFSDNSRIVSNLGKICIDLYKKNKIATVNKHIPGHGISKSDSHFSKPVTKVSKKELLKKDFKPFKECKSLFAMTSHIIYQKYDSRNVATHSSIIINKVIRKIIKFKGILISDDISMKALKHKLENNAIKALKAGCNLVLHCNGNINEMSKVAKVIPRIDRFTQKKHRISTIF